MAKRTMCSILILIFLMCVNSCDDGVSTREKKASITPKLFNLVAADKSNIKFSNYIDDLGEYTPYNTLYIYNGGGVAAGDINNDGLTDLCFTGNEVPVKLYLNTGDLHFRDITEKAGLFSKAPWVTGVTMADVNGDGFLDIYICRSGSIENKERHNLLFINNGDTTFTEKSKEYGLDDNGTSTHANFFDFDNDGDLDVYVVNHPDNFKLALDFFYYTQGTPDSLNSDKLFENVGGGKFVDITRKANLEKDNGFGLSVTTFDVNEDGWLDIYVANDFLAPDYLYINQGDKTFKNDIEKKFTKLSLFSMGSDAGDINNDGKLDLLVADMDPRSHYRRNKYDLALPQEYYKIQKRFFGIDQISRNMLFVNENGDFRDIGELSGVARTDWSWSVFIEDLNNDGLNDITITNGIKKDYAERDYSMLKFDGKDHYMSRYKHNAKDLIDSMPRSVLRNFVFENKDGFNFEDKSEAWGLDKFNTQGAALADLDNDGDIDLIFNNTDTFSVIYENKTEKLNNNNYLRIKCVGEQNKFGIGSEVEIFYGKDYQKKRLSNARGFQSSSEPILHFGIGKAKTIDSVKVHWLGGKSQTIKNIAANQVMMVFQKDADLPRLKKMEKQGLLTQVSLLDPPFQHQENEFFDFQRDKLLPFQLSKEGPPVETGDLNDDGKPDFIVGGAFGQPTTIYFQNEEGGFKANNEAFLADKNYEDLDLEILDYNNDGLPDIYIASGGNAYYKDGPEYEDRLYENKGAGVFERCKDCLPELYQSNSVAVASDFDHDGDEDLFVGGRHVPTEYGVSPQSALLRNDGGVFTDIAGDYPELQNIGLVKDAQWVDLKGDGFPELVVVGEWMPVSLFENEKGKLKEATSSYKLTRTNGLWNTIVASDIDNDGDMDFIVGNFGQNSIFKCSYEEPLTMYVGDLDKNGTIEPIIFHYIEGVNGTFADKDDLAKQMPVLNNKFHSYTAFANAKVSDIIPPEDEKRMTKKKVYLLNSVFLRNENNTAFTIEALPTKAQFAPVNAIQLEDYNNDGYQDILLAGNNVEFQYNQGRIDALPGLILFGDSNGNYKESDRYKSENMGEEVQDFGLIKMEGKKILLVANNNSALRTYLINGSTGSPTF